MIIYLQSIYYDLQLSIQNGSHIHIKVENDIEISEAKSEYTVNDKNKKKIKNFFVDAKARNTLYYALIRSEFNKITSCKNVRDIWHALE